MKPKTKKTTKKEVVELTKTELQEKLSYEKGRNERLLEENKTLIVQNSKLIDGLIKQGEY